MRWLVLLLLGCPDPSDPPETPCEVPVDAPECVVGLATADGFAPLSPGDEIPVWFGLQGGMHVDLAVQESGVTPVVRLAPEVREGGDVVTLGETIDVVTRAEEPACMGEQLTVRAVLDTSDGFVRACGLDGQTVTLEVEVTRQDGVSTTCSAEGIARLEDFTADQCQAILNP